MGKSQERKEKKRSSKKKEKEQEKSEEKQQNQQQQLETTENESKSDVNQGTMNSSSNNNNTSNLQQQQLAGANTAFPGLPSQQQQQQQQQQPFYKQNLPFQMGQQAMGIPFQGQQQNMLFKQQQQQLQQQNFGKLPIQNGTITVAPNSINSGVNVNNNGSNANFNFLQQRNLMPQTPGVLSNLNLNLGSQSDKLQQLNMYDFLKFPPSTQEEYRSVILDFLTSDLFEYPIHEKQLSECIIAHFQKSIKDVDKLMDQLEILPILSELLDKEAIELEAYSVGTKLYSYILDISREKLKQLSREFAKDKPKCMPQIPLVSVKKDTSYNNLPSQLMRMQNPPAPPPKGNGQLQQKEIDNLLQTKIGYQKVIFEQSEEISNLVNKQTTAENQALEKFKKDQQKIEFCDYGTKEKCKQFNKNAFTCNKAHFNRIVMPHTDESLGNCSYLDTCRHLDYCKYVHYKLDINIEHDPAIQQSPEHTFPDDICEKYPHLSTVQWVECDLRNIDFRALGKFDIIMADPPWDIHMNLPYDTMKDKEMRNLRFDLLQDNGLLFLWVTGRAMELGRECMVNWGYKRVEELIWIKTNQLQRIIRTGRTGHWLNHSKEHCLVGIKGNPEINANVDCDVIVSEVRETSRKPDEIYHLINRLSPYGRKIELFGRPHNCMNGWVTLGNQLPGVYMVEPEMLASYKKRYPEVDASQEQMEKNRQKFKSEKVLDNIYNSHIQSFNPIFKTKNSQQS